MGIAPPTPATITTITRITERAGTLSPYIFWGDFFARIAERRQKFLRPFEVALLDEQRLAQLVASDERFAGAVTRKQILYFAVLINLLRRANERRRNHLQGIGIRHPVALKALRLLAVKHGEDHCARRSSSVIHAMVCLATA